MNLTIIDAEGKELKCEKVHYPAGEVGVLVGCTKIKEPLKISADLYNADDFLVLGSIFHFLTEVGVTKYSVELGFVAFGRQDKHKIFERDGEQVAEITINTLPLIQLCTLMTVGTNVTIYDPHSDEMANFDRIGKLCCGINFKVIRPNIKKILYDGRYTPIFPDDGAMKRYGSEWDGDKLVGSKVRDDNGNITTNDFTTEIDKHADYCIIDDICDGGATFHNIARLLRDKGHKGELHLFVSHGLFTKGLKKLSEDFHTIRTATCMRHPEVVSTEIH